MDDLGVKHKIIIIDDEDDYGEDLQTALEQLGHEADKVNNLESAKDKIRLASDQEKPYTIATIDRNFRKSGKTTEFASGLIVLSYIKEKYPSIACIMISGHAVVPDEVLDLRDDNDLDYYLQKDRVDISTLKKAIKKAADRVKPKTSHERLKSLKGSLDKMREARDTLLDNLAHFTLIEAQKGIDVDIETKHQISKCKTKLDEVEAFLESITKEIKTLEDFNATA